ADVCSSDLTMLTHIQSQQLARHPSWGVHTHTNTHKQKHGVINNVLKERHTKECTFASSLTPSQLRHTHLYITHTPLYHTHLYITHTHIHTPLYHTPPYHTHTSISHTHTHTHTSISHTHTRAHRSAQTLSRYVYKRRASEVIEGFER